MEIYIHICSIIFVLLFVKLLRYLVSWFERAMIIFKTLGRAQSDIFYFLIMYLVIFFAFVVMCHIYYGAELTTFGSVPESMRTLFLMLMGELSYLDDMIVLNETLSFFFFIFFITSMQFILMNMFIAFIANAYSEVNVALTSQRVFEDELKYVHPLVRLLEARLKENRCCCCKKHAKESEKQKVEQHVKDTSHKIVEQVLWKNRIIGLSALNNNITEAPQKRIIGGEGEELRKEFNIFGERPIDKKILDEVD
jgi:hypothetical protein